MGPKIQDGLGQEMKPPVGGVTILGYLSQSFQGVLMIMSPISYRLEKPLKGEPVPTKDLAYAKARARNKAHAKLLTALKESGLTKTQLAKMLGKRPEQITRWFGGPGNVTIDTLAEILLATQGTMLAFSDDDVLAKPTRNLRGPDWMPHYIGAEPVVMRNVAVPEAPNQPKIFWSNTTVKVAG